MAALGGCDGLSGPDCAAIGEQAKLLSQSQTLKIQALSDMRETSRDGSDARCAAHATLGTGDAAGDNRNTTLYLRTYEENGNAMVAYQETPFQ